MLKFLNIGKWQSGDEKFSLNYDVYLLIKLLGEFLAI